MSGLAVLHPVISTQNGKEIPGDVEHGLICLTAEIVDAAGELQNSGHGLGDLFKIGDSAILVLAEGHLTVENILKVVTPFCIAVIHPLCPQHDCIRIYVEHAVFHFEFVLGIYISRHSVLFDIWTF